MKKPKHTQAGNLRAVDVIRHLEQGLEDGSDTLHVILRHCLRGPEVAVQERPQMQVQGLWRALGSKLQAPGLAPKSRARNVPSQESELLQELLTAHDTGANGLTRAQFQDT